MSDAKDNLPAGIKISPIRAFTDNYIWCIHNNREAVIVDPGEAEPVLDFLKANNLTLTSILITHHHHDHTGGIAKLVSMAPDIPVIGPRGGHILGITRSVSQGDTFTLDTLELAFAVMEVPGHTLDHIAFYGQGVLFCGDTLFNGGCGRLFEGEPAQMLHSLNKLTQLPADTLVYCAHEYTAANLAFAVAVEPTNSELADYQQEVESIRQQDRPTVPTKLSKQMAINPFLRAHVPGVQQAAAQKSDEPLTDEVAVFKVVREWKDGF
ncbi:hydroxyacylglutathione hydrolase [Alteromonas lipotrueiana]|uniref:hydroxyacylglutathione hydrolase n=1 Tax=Alteromonas lipotrueiana TaxID=2803815 RepID=UPI001C47A5D3|nr:hydroxyacylglutathione hydrolase [Alteromonas lipotrueiana]